MFCYVFHWVIDVNGVTLCRGISDPCPHEVSPLKASQCVWDRDHFRAASRYIVNVTIRNEITHENKEKMFPIITSEIGKFDGLYVSIIRNHSHGWWLCSLLPMATASCAKVPPCC